MWSAPPDPATGATPRSSWWCEEGRRLTLAQPPNIPIKAHRRKSACLFAYASCPVERLFDLRRDSRNAHRRTISRSPNRGESDGSKCELATQDYGPAARQFLIGSQRIRPAVRAGEIQHTGVEKRPEVVALDVFPYGLHTYFFAGFPSGFPLSGDGLGLSGCFLSKSAQNSSAGSLSPLLLRNFSFG